MYQKIEIYNNGETLNIKDIVDVSFEDNKVISFTAITEQKKMRNYIAEDDDIFELYIDKKKFKPKEIVVIDIHGNILYEANNIANLRFHFKTLELFAIRIKIRKYGGSFYKDLIVDHRDTKIIKKEDLT